MAVYAAIALAAWAALQACASAPQPEPQSLDQAFAQIQVSEAQIEHGRWALAREGCSCEDARAAAQQSEQASRELCDTAKRSADPDALARCERAAHEAGSQAQLAERTCASGAAGDSAVARAHHEAAR